MYFFLFLILLKVSFISPKQTVCTRVSAAEPLTDLRELKTGWRAKGLEWKSSSLLQSKEGKKTVWLRLAPGKYGRDNSDFKN